MNSMQETIAIIGLGYVGLPVAVAFSEAGADVLGFDLNEAKVATLKSGKSFTEDISDKQLSASKLRVTSNLEDLRGRSFFIVAVPTPVDENFIPDLGAVRSASELVGKVLGKEAVVVFESTVYPGVTEDECGPILEKVSGLKRGKDFFLGYSPERINPGDTVHTLRTIVKIVSGEDAQTLDRVASTYERIVPAGVHRAPSLRVAEAAKVVENIQRDINIALMNELAIIFDRLDISTKAVLEAAGTKWNFLKFSPGLVGGHCIGIDPYYLTNRAQQLGYQPDVILSARKLNNDMGRFLAERLVQLLAERGGNVGKARVGIMGVTFKENVGDIRNSRVPSIIERLKAFSIESMIWDPLADKAEAEHEYKLKLASAEDLKNLDALVLAVAHKEFISEGESGLSTRLAKGGVVMDVKSVLNPAKLRTDIKYWAL